MDITGSPYTTDVGGGITAYVTRDYLNLHGFALRDCEGARVGRDEVPELVRALRAHQGGLIELGHASVDMPSERANTLADKLSRASRWQIHETCFYRWGDGSEGYDTPMVRLATLARAGMDTRLLHLLVTRGLIHGEVLDGEVSVDFRAANAAWDAVQPPQL